MNNSRLPKFIWLHERYSRMPKHHSAIEQVENLHLRADKLKVKALEIEARLKPRCKCGKPTHSNSPLCVVCEEMANHENS